MLFKQLDKASGKTLVTSKPLLTKVQDGYVRPSVGSKDWWGTTTSIWNIDEIMRRRVRDWRRLTGETGHSGARDGDMRADHNSIYTGTHSVFPAPLMEAILLRYGGNTCGATVLDAFTGGVPRGLVSALMGYTYYGFDIREEQLNENRTRLAELGVEGCNYILGDGCALDIYGHEFDVAVTCPPYYNLEVYSDQADDLSNLSSYQLFNERMQLCAVNHRKIMKPGAFVCIVVGPFRDKKTGELIDFPAHTAVNFQKAGFIFWQSIVLSKNFSSAAKRSTTSWKGLKLVPRHEFLQVFRTPQ